MTEPIRPLARTQDLLTEELDGELVIYDQGRDLASRLNRTAALVWRSADGQRDIADLVAVLREELGDVADEDLVLVTLDRLEEQGLIEAGYKPRDPDTSRLSRRRFIRRVGAVGAAALALPVVQSFVAPAAAAAQSGTCDACSCPCGCTTCEPCISCGGYCQPPGGCDCLPSCGPCTCGAGAASSRSTAKWRQ